MVEHRMYTNPSCRRRKVKEHYRSRNPYCLRGKQQGLLRFPSPEGKTIGFPYLSFSVRVEGDTKLRAKQQGFLSSHSWSE
uniref:Uncharacterized protein n=1 Tax=Nelumbo nucifera TaxID=4432 RepID=A0A823A185_NELNU|nr:TPA_asm: hypothetical protein HUJ06_019006 [Nelumbo nucifera]